MTDAATFHASLIVIDGLEYSNWSRALFEELKAGGVSAVHATAVYWEDARQTLALLADWNRRFREHADLICPALSGEDIRAAKREGRIAFILGAQNCSPIEQDLGLVEIFRRLGLSVMQLTYNNQSPLGGGCYEAVDSGLTRFGREVLREMNRVGMIADLSHSGEKTTLDAIEHSSRPICISHANPNFFHENIRNKSDRVLRALGESGGMLGFSLYPLHIGGAGRSLEDFTGHGGPHRRAHGRRAYRHRHRYRARLARFGAGLDAQRPLDLEQLPRPSGRTGQAGSRARPTSAISPRPCWTAASHVKTSRASWAVTG